MKTITPCLVHWLGPESPLGPFVAGMATGLLGIMAVLAIGSIIVPPLLWLARRYWKWWLG